MVRSSPLATITPVIINPVARGRRARGAATMIGGLSPQIELRFTQGPEDAQRLGLEAAREGAAIVVAAGGDGTVGQVAAGLCRARSEGLAPALGILPAGTMNVFARELGIPLNLRDAWRVIEGGHRRTIDAWIANQTPFLQLGGIGIDAEIVRLTTASDKVRFGPFGYARSALKVAARPSPPFLVCDDQGETREGVALLMGNGRFYGGPVPVFPGASLEDGLLDVILLADRSPSTLASLAHAVGFADFAAQERVHYFQTRHLQIREINEIEVPLELDGEPMGGSPVEVRLADAPIDVLCPRRAR